MACIGKGNGQPQADNTGAYEVKIYDVDQNGKKTGNGTMLTASDTTFAVTTSTTEAGQNLNPVVNGAADSSAWFKFVFAALVQSADYQKDHAGKYVEVTYPVLITATADAATGDTPDVTNKVEVNATTRRPSTKPSSPSASSASRRTQPTAPPSRLRPVSVRASASKP